MGSGRVGCVAVNMVCSDSGDGDGEVCAKPLEDGWGVAEPVEGGGGAGMAIDIAIPACTAQAKHVASLLFPLHYWA